MGAERAETPKKEVCAENETTESESDVIFAFEPREKTSIRPTA